ncbi:MAG: hypothetical protein HY698_04180 [Deltaproteobacteria bacterium]|nr:hypothetical protein [Deltaproteobacteria bacterium]
MRCPTCKADDAVEAKVVLRLQVPLAKGGGLKLLGSFTQDEIRRQWGEQKKNCVCVRCGAAFVYIDGEGLTDEV